MPKKAPKNQESKISELTADLQRLQADFINFKARAEKDRQEALKLGREAAVQELLPIFDNLERAFRHTPDDLTDNPWVKGINGLEKQLVSVMEGLGLKKIEAVGRPFDPATMEAVGVDDGGDGEELVTEELQSGYMLDGRVLRPAMVKVSN